MTVPRAPLHDPPLPPIEFMYLVGSAAPTPEETVENYLEVGAACRHDLEVILGDGWDWHGKRLLDFGCGAGRFLRHILDWAEEGEIFGSDVEQPMAAWASSNLCPPVAAVKANGFEPPLAFPDDHFDVVTAFSVFTHLGVNWAEWLLEMKRVLKPDGVFVASILDQSCAELLTSVPYSEDTVGMSVWAYALPHIPYVNVLHSHWWIREHWGRAFEILSIEPGDIDADQRGRFELPGQGLVIAKPLAEPVSAMDLRRESPEDDRYIAAHIHQQEMFKAEAEELKEQFLESEVKVALLEQLTQKSATRYLYEGLQRLIIGSRRLLRRRRLSRKL